ncbi:MAG: copper transporter [Firmicutes bacterium]|mgnify:CR=1 FL=1|nr:copper transporter [Bacillota bacterium]
MNFGFRYHLASLMAVFFSLILGILIGGALFPDHVLVEEQASLITELEERLKDVQSSLVALQTEKDFSSLAWSKLRDSISRNRLTARTVVLVDSEPKGDSPLVSTLRLAGAEVKEVTLDKIEDVLADEDMSFVFWLSERELSPELQGIVQKLAGTGAHLCFVWGGEVEPSLNSLPASLQVDGVDTALGEVALLLGLINRDHGHYGVQKNAQGLFP